MTIIKNFRKVNANLKESYYTQNNKVEMDKEKGRIRRSVETDVTTSQGDRYDRYDIIADMVNALNDLLTIAESNGWDTNVSSINKYKNRQSEITDIINNL